MIYSVCDGNYQIYHYDYRGSVVAVTDINGTVTDTIKYGAYGNQVIPSVVTSDKQVKIVDVKLVLTGYWAFTHPRCL